MAKSFFESGTGQCPLNNKAQWITKSFLLKLTLSFGSCSNVQIKSGDGFPTTSQISEMLAPLSASIDCGRVLNTGPSAKKTKWKKDSISIKWFQRRATLNSRWYSQLMSSTSLSSLFPTALWTSHFTIPSWYLREIFGITCEWPFEKIQSKRIKFMLKSSKSKWAHTLLLEE